MKPFAPFLKPKLEELFGADLRSLAALRIGVALIIIVDLAQRSGDLVAHYSDFGLAPRTAVIEGTASRWLISLHFMSGVWEVQALLFLMAGLFALAMLVGYKTRLVSFVSWILLISLHTRNPFVNGGGDIMLRVVLFWCMFLPLGRCFSIDNAWATSREECPTRCLSLGTFAYSTQILFIYWFTAILKSGPEWHSQGSAIYYALSADEVVTGLGHFLLQFPPLLIFLTHSVLWFEFLGPVLLFSPLLTTRVRMVAVIGFWLLHLGILATLRIGIFPAVGIVSMIFFVPTCVWDMSSLWLQQRRNLSLTVFYDGECGFCWRSVQLLKSFLLVPAATIRRAQDDPSVLADMKRYNSWVVVDGAGIRHFRYEAALAVTASWPFLSWLVPVLKLSPFCWLGEKLYRSFARHRKTTCDLSPIFGSNLRAGVKHLPIINLGIVVLVIYLLFWNLGTIPNSRIKMSERFKSVGYLLRLDQNWQMFAPFPAKDDGWFVIPGKLSNGTVLDLFSGHPGVDWKKPSSISAMYKNQRWRKYMEYVQKKESQRTSYAQYLCRSWNTNHNPSAQLLEFEIIFMREWTLPNYEYSAPEKISLLKYQCSRS
jgi:predicted DCC family thiol-disulfide oxidoreductase YuxK